jgi:hypothetical protein
MPISSSPERAIDHLRQRTDPASGLRRGGPPHPDAAQMGLVEDDDVVQTLPPDRTDDPLNVEILPR